MAAPDVYPDELAIAEGHDRYFALSGFGREYDDAWVRIQLGMFRVVFPNTPGRVRAARLHDLHHVATRYGTDLAGEAEIGAWELASGCAHHWPAWTLDLYAFAIGLAVCPGRVFQAFVRGRHSTNLYRLEGEFHEGLMAGTVGELRHRLRLDQPTPPATALDRMLFLAWAGVALAWLVGGALTGPLFYLSLYAGRPMPRRS